MRFLPTRVHGMVDWILGALLVALPWVLGLDRGGPEAWVPMALGITALAVTFFTDHEFGVVRRIPMVGHLWVDGLAGALLAAVLSRRGLGCSLRRSLLQPSTCA